MNWSYSSDSFILLGVSSSVTLHESDRVQWTWGTTLQCFKVRCSAVQCRGTVWVLYVCSVGRRTLIVSLLYCEGPKFTVIVLVSDTYVVIFNAYVLMWAPIGRFNFGFLIKIVCDFSCARYEGACQAKETVTEEYFIILWHVGVSRKRIGKHVAAEIRFLNKPSLGVGFHG
jgi:hypothetical protein